MKKPNSLTNLTIVILFSILLSNCKKDNDNDNNDNNPEIDCIEWVLNNRGYEVWAGDTPLIDTTHFATMIDGYNIDEYDYHLIGSGTTTKSFSTGDYKYYIVVAKYQACVDAVQFYDSSYYDYFQGYTLIGGLAEFYEPYGTTNSRILGAPDGIGGCLGYIDLYCPDKPWSGYLTPTYDNGFFTDTKTITSRGGGLIVYIADPCDCDSPQPND